ncbi:hypothetical protein QFC22_000398 [Naganishia vaughanmartiniae]|uniref:Uncharacterized protein n=1 Tax=Naganishia vaughanmartiniae TaxID=1424756 RepID=A0ACC2XN80_9TREE|nr:hypothetical protein QFC22_000398 [Naganishia vaughanmartiniae]
MPATRPTPRKKKAAAAKALPDGSLPVARPSISTTHVGAAGSQPLTISAALNTLTPAEQDAMEDLTLESAMRDSGTINSHHGSAAVDLASPPLASSSGSPLEMVNGLSPPIPASTTDFSTSSLSPSRHQAADGRVGGLSSTMTGEDYLAIIHAQARKISRLTNDNLRHTMAVCEYPIARPALGREASTAFPACVSYSVFAIIAMTESTARAVIASARLLNQLNDDLNYKRLLPDRKRDLRNQLKGFLVINPLIKEVLFVNSDLNRPKFFEEWPLDKMLITATGSER